MNFNDPIWLFSHPSQRDLALLIHNYSEKHKATNKRQVIFKESILWKEFEDGYPNLFIENVKDMKNKDVLFLASFHEPGVIFEQISVMDSIPRYLAKSLTVLLPYFPCSTMERVDEEGQVATAKSVTRLLSGIPMTKSGPCEIVVFDIHALQERFYFSDQAVPRLETALPLLIDQVKILMTRKNSEISASQLAFAFPDDGAQKRFGKPIKSALSELHSDLIVCNKTRDGDAKRIKVKEGDPRGCHVIIVDDLVRSGGTLIECGKVLLSEGASAVSAFVTHAVFSQESWRQFCNERIFTNFWITDSIPHARIIAQHKPFKLLSIAPLIADIDF